MADGKHRRERRRDRFQLSGQINEDAFRYYRRLDRVKQYIEQNYSEHISLERAAMVAGVERKYFSAFFHQKVGVCFRDWLMWLRVDRAKQLIKSKNYPITHIALETGFNDLRTFERKFKMCTGITAREFKRRSGACRDKNPPRIHDH